MKKAFFAMLMGAALVLGACGSDSDKADSGSGSTTSQADGEKIIQQKCISCHGDKLNNGSAPDISKIGGKLSEEEIADVLENGQNAMPAKLVTGDDAKAVASWLATQK
ncbi:MAG: cytochrome c [Kurthia sp.]|nr:cytochrome c [Candidatus Kurthia equi]